MINADAASEGTREGADRRLREYIQTPRPERKMPELLLRYVVLHHAGFGEPHYDLMFESAPGSLLTTWRAADWPLAAGDLLTHIGDHRRDYLDYEGPVSNNRGHVHRVQSGTCHVAAQSDQVTLQIDQPEPTLILLKRESEDHWVVVEISA